MIPIKICSKIVLENNKYKLDSDKSTRGFISMASGSWRAPNCAAPVAWSCSTILECQRAKRLTFSNWDLRTGFPVTADSELSCLCCSTRVLTSLIRATGSFINSGTFFLLAGKQWRYVTIDFSPCSSWKE